MTNNLYKYIKYNFYKVFPVDCKITELKHENGLYIALSFESNKVSDLHMMLITYNSNDFSFNLSNYSVGISSYFKDNFYSKFEKMLNSYNSIRQFISEERRIKIKKILE